jgi:hypothetical protein
LTFSVDSSTVSTLAFESAIPGATLRPCSEATETAARRRSSFGGQAVEVRALEVRPAPQRGIAGVEAGHADRIRWHWHTGRFNPIFLDMISPLLNPRNKFADSWHRKTRAVAPVVRPLLRERLRELRE